MKFLYGSEKYLIHQKMMKLKQEFKKSNPNASLVSFDFDESTIEKIKDELLQSQGLFSSKKMLIIQNALGLGKFEQGELHEILKEKNIGNSSDLEVIFVEVNEKIPNNTSSKLGQYLKRQSSKLEFKKLTDEQLNQWVNSEFLKKSGKKVSCEIMAVKELILLSRGNLWQLSNDIAKLVSYKGSGTVTLDNVQSLCSGKVEVKIFDLVDAIGSNNKKRALTLKQQLIEQGDNEFYIFTMILFQVRNLLKVSECLQKQLRDPQLIKQQTGLHPFVIQKTINNLSQFSPERIKRVYQVIAVMDRKTKTGELKMSKAIDWLIVRM